MNIVDRALIRSVAANQVKLERRAGKEYSSDAVISIWNTDYRLVKDGDVPALQKQYALEVAVERGACESTLSLNPIGVAEVKIDALRGRLTLGPKDSGGAPDGALES